jgi:uncharacterized protein YcfL
MKKMILLIFISILLISCNSKDKFKQKFKDCFTLEQIELILNLNSDFDKFVIKNHPDKSTDLNIAYYYMTETIINKGDLSYYWLQDDKLSKIKNELIKVGLYDNLDNEKSFLINYENGDYLKCLKKISKTDNETSEILDSFLNSGGINMSIHISRLRHLIHNDNLNSISKILTIFEFIVGQIEYSTKTDKK